VTKRAAGPYPCCAKPNIVNSGGRCLTPYLTFDSGVLSGVFTYEKEAGAGTNHGLRLFNAISGCLWCLCAACDGFGFARNAATTTFDVFYWLQVTNFDGLLNSAPNGPDYIDIWGLCLLPMGRQRLPTIQNFRAAEISSRQRVDPDEQIFFARHAGHLIAQLSIFEEEQRWDGPNVVPERKTLVFVDVNFGDFDRVGLFTRNLIQQRRNHFTWTTPFRPKIDDDRLIALHNFAIKVRFVEIDGGRVVVHSFRKNKSKSE
jgi:hypothetical protein